ncbi:hypothetical protein D9M73_284020 [compost metagenome]
MDCGAVRFWVGFPEVYDVIAISPHTNAGCASGGHLLLVMTPVSCAGAWWPISTQTPCLKLNGYPKKPENDAFVRQIRCFD